MKKVMCLLAIMFMIANTSAQTRVIAHRGFWKTQGSAQNSITSLLKADSIGCYGSEFDVWLTKDNGLVVSHDGIIQGHKVEESTLKELTGLWLANGECVPSLKELLETAKRKTSLKLVLELKAHSKPEREIKAVEEIVSMIKKMGLEPRMIYITFSSHALKELIRQAPTSTPVYYLKGDLSPQQLKELGSAGPDYHFSEFYRYTDWIESCHALGLKVNVWTVNKKEEMQYFWDKVDFITTDEPLGLLKDIMKVK